jgi:undecaprenyl-diphosphatase
MPGLIARLGDLPPLAVYAVAVALVFAETGSLLGLVLPGEITLLVAGYLVYHGTLRLPATIVVLSLAAVAGDAVAYSEGRRVGPRLRSGRLGRWVGRRRWSRADALVLRYGGRAVALGRFVGIVRTLVPRLAGLSGVPYRRVFGWNVLGAVGWVGGSVLLGYLVGDSYQRAADLFGRATGALLLLVAVVIALVLIGRYLGRHRDPVASFGERLVHTRPLHWAERWYTSGFRQLTVRFGSGGAVVVNLALGMAALLAIGVALTWVVDRLVRHSGFPLVDSLVAQWLADRRTPATVDAARATLSVLRGSVVIAAVAVVGLALNPRPRSWRNDLLGVLGTAGAFIPLLILALAAEWVRPSGVTGPFLPNQVTLVTAGLGMVAWLLSRRLPWGAAVAGWLAALGGVLLLDGARVYLGLNWLSQVVASTLLGALWVLVFVVAWHTRVRLSVPPFAAEQPAPDRARAHGSVERFQHDHLP